MHTEVGQDVPEPLDQVVALGDAHVQQQFGDLSERSGEAFEQAFVLELAVVDRPHDGLEVAQWLPGYLMGGDQAGHDCAGAGTGDPGERTDQTDALDATPLQDQIDLRGLRPLQRDHGSSSSMRPASLPPCPVTATITTNPAGRRLVWRA